MGVHILALRDKLLNKSNSYIYYKENFTSLKKKYEDLQKKHDATLKTLDGLKGNYNRLFKKYEKDYLFFDFDGIMSKFYISPLIEAPFSFEDKRCFAFMDHFSKYLSKIAEKKDNPLVSIIFPVYNYEEYILEAINSVLNQSYENFELIIVDDNSNDGTVNLLNSINDEKIRIFLNNNHEGLSFCRNKALTESKGDYIFYLDMNNFWEVNYLKSMMGAFFELPEADAVYSGKLVYDENWKKMQSVVFGSYNKSLLFNKNYISLSSFAHKNKYSENIIFDESVNSLEDWNFILEYSNDSKMFSVPILQSKTNNFGNLNEEGVRLIHEKFSYYHDFSSEYALNKKISIIIPSYELLDDLKECIDTILSFNSEFIEIIVVDNNSNDDVKNYLNSLSSERKIKYIQNDVNYGFTFAVEQGISLSDETSDILLLNNDAILTKGALEAMQYYAYNIPDCGIVVPLEVLYAGDKRIKNNVPFADVNFECDVTPSRTHKNIINVPVFHDGELLELNFAPFFCTYIKRDVYDKTLGLDPELGRHYRSDRIFSNFTRHILNMKIYQTSKAKVYHKSQQATKKLKKNNEEYNIIFNKNQWDPELAKQLNYRTPLWDID